MTKTALITGASAGFGKASAFTLAQLGFDLYLLARRQEKLAALQQEIQKHHNVQVKILCCDVRDKKMLVSLLGEIQGGLDVVVNNAGLSQGKGLFQDSSWEDMQTMIDVNITGMTHVAHLCTPHLIQSKGLLINISSISGYMPYPGGHVYGGTKAYVQQLSNNLRLDFLGTGVRVTDIAPGKANTEFSVVRFKGDQAQADAEYEGYEALVAEDIARAVAFCASQPHHVNIDSLVVSLRDWARPGFSINRKRQK